MKSKLPEDIEKSCALCEHARKMDITGQVLCARTKDLKKVSEDHVCKKFSFDILAYKPRPSKLPKFTIESAEDFI